MNERPGNHARRPAAAERQGRARGAAGAPARPRDGGRAAPPVVVGLERWADIPDAPGYQASDLGHVRSLDRTLADGRLAGGVLLKPRRDGKGYWCVTLVIGGKRRTRRVHRLVKLAFTGPARGRQVRHKLDDKDDLRLAALLYGTQRDNERDKRRNGRLKGKRGQGKQVR